jgi:predicted Zn-dependent protease
MSPSSLWIDEFRRLSQSAIENLNSDESLGLTLAAEDQDYVRFNRGRTRQTTHVSQQRITLDFRLRGRRLVLAFDRSGRMDDDRSRMAVMLERAREECGCLPEDPYLSAFENQGSSDSNHSGQLPSSGDVSALIFNTSKEMDLAGLYAGGVQVRASTNSAGTFHSYASQSFFLDYSLYTVNSDGENKAVKGLHAGNHFVESEWRCALEQSAAKLQPLRKKNMVIPRGHYRVYLAPQAIEALTGMLSWGALSHGAYRRGESALERLARGEQSLSPLFSLKENFALGLSPRFNAAGMMSPESLPLIEQGKLRSFLINERTAREYGITANGANASEGMRSPEITSGTLETADILKSLDTGLYLGNLHYLNWSERKTARLTGMTRYACFWVENGELIAPIQDLRFDESLYRIFGSELESIGQESLRLPETDSYEARALGGCKVPGMLLRDFRFTL